MLYKFVVFMICLLPWFFSLIIPVDYNYFNTIQLPFFAPGKSFYGIAWTIIYVLIAISIYSIVSKYRFRDIPKSYKIALIVNYLFNQSFFLV